MIETTTLWIAVAVADDAEIACGEGFSAEDAIEECKSQVPAMYGNSYEIELRNEEIVI